MSIEITKNQPQRDGRMKSCCWNAGLMGNSRKLEFHRLDVSLDSQPALAGYACQRLAEHGLLGVILQQSDTNNVCDAIEVRIRTVDSASIDRIFGSLPIQRTDQFAKFSFWMNSTLIGTASMIVDALHIGPTWRSVVPMKERASNRVPKNEM